MYTGCVLFELLTGITAFDEPSLLELSAAILEREPVPLLTLRPDAPPELELIVLRCLTKNPAERYQNVAELTMALYPFGPRRARISAERCYHMLKNAGIMSTSLELASAYPPSLGASGRVTAPSVSFDAGPRTTTPASVDLVVDADEALLRGSGKGRKLAVLAALGVAAGAAVLLLMNTRGPSVQAPAAAAAPARGVELAPAGTAAPAKVIDLDDSATSAAPRGTTSVASSAPRSAKPGYRAPRPIHAPPPSAVRKARPGEDELDPGF